MSENKITNFQFAPNLKERYKGQAKIFHISKERGEYMGYSIILGDYSEKSIADIATLYEQEGERLDEVGKKVFEDLMGIEVFFKNTIDHLLTIKGAKPVILLDIGAMVGLSWRRLANFYEDQVRTGKLVFAINNLNNNLDNLRQNRLTEETRSFLDKTDDLIQSIDATPSQIRRRRLYLPDGTLVSLEHSADLVHESLSMTYWSKIPDIDILRIPTLLSEYGMYLVPKVDVKYGQFRYFERPQSIALAHEQLQSRYGLKKVIQAEEGNMKDEYLNYIIFKNKHAPMIKVDR